MISSRLAAAAISVAAALICPHAASAATVHVEASTDSASSMFAPAESEFVVTTSDGNEVSMLSGDSLATADGVSFESIKAPDGFRVAVSSDGDATYVDASYRVFDVDVASYGPRAVSDAATLQLISSDSSVSVRFSGGRASFRGVPAWDAGGEPTSYVAVVSSIDGYSAEDGEFRMYAEDGSVSSVVSVVVSSDGNGRIRASFSESEPSSADVGECEVSISTFDDDGEVAPTKGYAFRVRPSAGGSNAATAVVDSSKGVVVKGLTPGRYDVSVTSDDGKTVASATIGVSEVEHGFSRYDTVVGVNIYERRFSVTYRAVEGFYVVDGDLCVTLDVDLTERMTNRRLAAVVVACLSVVVGCFALDRCGRKEDARRWGSAVG